MARLFPVFATKMCGIARMEKRQLEHELRGAIRRRQILPRTEETYVQTKAPRPANRQPGGVVEQNTSAAHHDLHDVTPDADLVIAYAVDGAVLPLRWGGGEGEGVGVVRRGVVSEEDPAFAVAAIDLDF